MPLDINTNIASLNTQGYLNQAQSNLSSALTQLSSGLRINSAKDDSAGLAVVTSITTQINGQNQAVQNANDGISLIQTADGALGNISDSLQTMRNLAVQAANGTNSAANRQSLNNELQQLSASIQDVAVSTNFNGISLLRGSFYFAPLQVGAGSSDVVRIDSIGNFQTSSIGYTTSVSGGAATAALNAGDLTLNNVQVGASQVGSAPGQDASSAYAAATAINAVSQTSGVTATASTTLLGTAPTSQGDIAGSTFNINGVDIGAIAAGSDAASQGANVAAAITAASAQTGVTATASATGAVTLTTADGRNIIIGLDGTAANATAAAADRANFIKLTGLSSGVGSEAFQASAAQNTIQLSGNISTGSTFAVNGVNFIVKDSLVPSSVVSANTVYVSVDVSGHNNSAATVASALSGAIALAQSDARTSAALGTLSASDNGAGLVTLNDNTAGPSSTQISASTGVVTNVVAGAAAQAALSATTHGAVTLNSTDSTGIDIGGASPGGAGLTPGQVEATPNASVGGIALMNISTQNGAISAISALDGALNTVSNARASLGGYQNQLESAVSNLRNSTMNQTDTRSSIEDTDFAAATANLTRDQILQRAGVAMLAMSNMAPRDVLSLLR